MGSAVTHRFGDAAEPFFGGGEVLECDPPRRLTYTAGFVPTAKDPTPDTRLTTATFELVQTGEIVKLTMTSVGPREQMRVHVDEGWVLVVANPQEFPGNGEADAGLRTAGSVPGIGSGVLFGRLHGMERACHANRVSRRCTKIDWPSGGSERTPSDTEHIVS